MHHHALNDPFDASAPLVDTTPCPPAATRSTGKPDELRRDFEARQAPDFRGLEHFHGCPGAGCTHPSHQSADPACTPAGTGERMSADRMLDRTVENAVMRAIFPTDLERRTFLKVVGRGTAAAVLGSLFDFGTAKAMAADPIKGIEKKDLSIGFIPITCATPIIMAEPMGFYSKHGLNAKVRKAAGWAVVRDWAVNKEVDAAHMLSPMPLALTLGAGSPAVPFLMPAVENINGQAITLSLKHKGVKEAKDMKGFRFCVPFTYSMHNYLLRYFLAEGGLHPDKDVQIRIVPPPEMVANLKADNVDGYLAPDPFNQRAVYENVGFLFKLTKDLWEGHPCCAFAISKEFTETHPNTFKALFRSIVDATHFAADPANRKDIAKAISPANYLNQPEIVLQQVLTGRYADGLGGIQNVPDRINFDPFPWHSMAMWILSQMKRWKHVEGEFDYRMVAEQVYLAAECDQVMADLGYPTRGATSRKHVIMGREFDPARADEYARSFPISNL